MLESCFTPELVVEITDQPVRRHGVDAAIFFSDIVVPLKAIGVDLDIVPGVGPVVADPIRDAAGVATLRDLTDEDVAPVLEAVRILAGASGPLGRTPLIGFAGAPFTLASYLIEGGPSRDHARTKSLMYSDPGALERPRRPVGAHRGRLPADAGPRRGQCRPAVRLLGRCPAGGRLRGVGPAACAHRAVSGRGPVGGPLHPEDPLRRRDRRAARDDVAGGLGGDGRGLPRAPGPGGGAGAPRCRPAGQPGPGRRAGQPRRRFTSGSTRSWPRPDAAVVGTSSTSGTGCSRTPIPGC